MTTATPSTALATIQPAFTDASVCSAFHLSPAQCAALGINPNPDGNHIVLNAATGNGASPDPDIAPLPGADLLWMGRWRLVCRSTATETDPFPRFDYAK